MANEKWSSFTDVGAPTSGDTVVGLHDGVNVQFDTDSLGITPTQVQQSAFNSGIDSGLADAYVVTLSPSALLDPINGTVVSFSPLNNNLTTTPTVAVNGDSAFTIVLPNGSPVQAGDISTSNLCYLIFDQANAYYYLLTPAVSGGGNVNPIQIQEAAFVSGIDSGVADAYVVTLSPSAAFTPSNGTVVSFSPLNNNLTTSPTLAVNGGADLPILLPNNMPVSANDIATSNVAIYVVYSNGVWLLMNPVVSYASLTTTQQNAFISGSDTGIVNAYIWTNQFFSPSITFSGNLIDGAFVVLTGILNTNTGTSTIFVAGGAQPITTPDGNPLVGGELIANYSYVFMYSNAGLVLLNSSLAASGGGDAFASGISLLSAAVPAGGFTITNSVPETSIDFSALLTTVGDFNLDAYNATSIDFSNLSTTVNFTLNVAVLTSLSMPALSSVTGNFFFQNVNASMTSLSIPSLTSVTGTFYLAAQPTSVDLSLLATIGGGAEFANMNLATFSLPAFTSTGGSLVLGGQPTLLTFDFPVLATITGTLSGQCLATTINLPSIVTIGTGISFAFATFIAYMPNLTTFSFGAGLLTVGGDVNMWGASLNLASVDGILASLAALDGTGGTTSYDGFTITLSGGTSAVPDAAGLASIVTLVARGNTVNHN